VDHPDPVRDGDLVPLFFPTVIPIPDGAASWFAYIAIGLTR
jgi:hypothetical protein